jgi:hypothetical protein
MKLKITSAMTFAGKQYENYRPEITVELEDGATPAEIEDELAKMNAVLEQSGAVWKTRVLS